MEERLRRLHCASAVFFPSASFARTLLNTQGSHPRFTHPKRKSVAPETCCT